MSCKNENKKEIKNQPKTKKAKISPKKIEKKKIHEQISKQSDKKNRKKIENKRHQLKRGNSNFLNCLIIKKAIKYFLIFQKKGKY